MRPIFEILLFEDDPSDAELIAIKLKQLDVEYHLTFVLNKQDLEKKLSASIPDLIICDYNLPGVTGSEILSYIRDKHPDLPFILVSGFIDPSKAVEAMVAGASDYVMKDDLNRLIPAAKRELLRYKEKAKQQELLNKAHKIAKMGYWEYKPETEDLTWTDEIYHLHEVPLCQPIDLATGISFYKKGPDRATIEKAVEDAINEGKPFDLELNILSAKGNEKWIHAIGQAEFRKGKCLRIFGSAQDITDRRKAQIKLEKTQQKLSNIILHSTNLYYEHDSDHNTTYVSPQSQNFFGLSPDECKRTWKKLFTDHPENQKGLKYTQKAIDTGTPQPEYELQAKHKDGSILWVRVNEAPVIEDGKTAAIVGSLTDITGQKQTFEKIQMLSKVASETQNLVIITDRKGNIEWVNKAFEKKTGFSLSESYGFTPPELLSGPATEPEITKNHLTKIRNKESFSETTVIHTKKGKPIWVRSHISPIFDKNGEVKKYFSIQEDITQEMEFKNQLKLQNERLRESHIIGGLADWDFIVETGEVYWSENMFNIYERDPEKGPPDYETILSYYPDDHKYHDKKVREAIDKGKPYSIDVRLITEKNNEKYIHVEGRTIADADGNIVRLHGTVLDITSRKKAELESNELQRIIENNISEIYILDTKSLKILYSNDVASQNFGYSSEELKKLTKFQLNLDHIDNRKQILKLIAELKRGNKKVISFETIHHRADGTTYDALVHMKKDTYKGQEVFIASALNISEKKLLESHLEEQLFLNNTILDSLPGLFYMIDKNMKILRVNKNVYEFFGLQKSDLENLHPFELIAESEHDLILEKFREALDTGYAETETLLVSNGKVRNFYLNGKLMVLNGEEYIVGNGIDITEKVRTQHYNSVLVQEIHHRVKNNLAIISGLLWLELSNVKDTNAEIPLQRSINRIHSMGKVHEMLYKNLDLSTINIRTYLTELSDFIKNSMKTDKLIDIKLEIENLDINVNVAIPLGMLVNELITNSIKYAFNGQKGEISLAFHLKNDKYHVFYKDNGRGFMHQQSNNNFTTLGLTIVEALLNQINSTYKLNTKNKFELSFNFDLKTKGPHSNLNQYIS